MTTAYAKQIASAKRLIKSKGQAVTWRQTTDATPDPAQPWHATGNAAVDHAVNIVFLPDGQARFAALIKGTDVPEGRVLGYMGAVDFEPSVRDIVLRGGNSLRVVSVDPLAPDGTPIIYVVGFEQ